MCVLCRLALRALRYGAGNETWLSKYGVSMSIIHVTGAHSSTVHSGKTREEAVHKALQHIPYSLLEEHEYPASKASSCRFPVSWESA